MNLSYDNKPCDLSLGFLPLPKGSGAQGRSESNKLIQMLTPRIETKQDKVAQTKERDLEKTTNTTS
jgi:hypothetical protein